MAITYFTPFLGTELYDLCVREGLYDGFDPSQNVYKYSPLKMPQLSASRIEELIRVFMEEFESYKNDIHNIPDAILQHNNRSVDQLYGSGGEMPIDARRFDWPKPDARATLVNCNL